MSDVYQWTGSNTANLGSAGNWVDTTSPGMGQVPGVNDVAIIEVGQGLFGTLNVAALDLVQSSGAPTLSITGSSTQVTAASVGIAGGFTLDTGAYLQAGTMGIDGGGTVVTVQNNAVLYVDAGENDILDVGASNGTCSLLITHGGVMYYDSTAASGTLTIAGVSNAAATLTVSAGGYFDTTCDSLNVGGHSGASGYLTVTGPGSQFIEDNYGYTTIGDYGELEGSAQGTVLVSNGAYASLDSMGGSEIDLGTSAGMAKIIVTGANSDIQAGPYIEIGQSNSNIAGEVLVQAGGEFDVATDALLNNGTIAVTGANSLFTGRILAQDLGTTLQISSGGTVHVADDETAGLTRITAATLNVREALSLYGGAEIIGNGTILAATIANGAGLIIANGGTLAVSGSITGTGTLRILAGATLQLNGSTVATQTTQFTSGTETLALSDAAHDVTYIHDFAAGNAIDLLSDPATKLSYATGALTVLNGTKQVAKLQIKGSYSAANFKLASDGHGGSLISYVTTGAKFDPVPQTWMAHQIL